MWQDEKDLKPGDVVVSDGGIRRRIVACRRTGYEWEYPEMPGKTSLSADSTDPWFCWWRVEANP